MKLDTPEDMREWQEAITEFSEQVTSLPQEEQLTALSAMVACSYALLHNACIKHGVPVETGVAVARAFALDMAGREDEADQVMDGIERMETIH